MTRLQETISRAKTDFQRMALAEWGRRNPRPLVIKNGAGGGTDLDIVPTLCVCLTCGTDALIMPDPEIVPARGFVFCPSCFAHSANPPQK